MTLWTGRQVLVLFPPARLGEVQRIMRWLLDRGPANVIGLMTTVPRTTIRLLDPGTELLLPSSLGQGPAETATRKGGGKGHHLALCFHTTPHHPVPTASTGRVVAGIVVPPSSFWTGLPHTLLLNDRLVSGPEAQGLGFLCPLPADGGAADHPLALHYPSRIVPLGAPFPITGCQGNVLSAIGGHESPTRYLADLLQVATGQIQYHGPLQPQPDVYLELQRPMGSASPRLPERELVRVLGGGLSRGNLALDQAVALQVGEVGHFFLDLARASRKAPSPSSPAGFLSAGRVLELHCNEEVGEVVPQPSAPTSSRNRADRLSPVLSWGTPLRLASSAGFFYHVPGDRGPLTAAASASSSARMHHCDIRGASLYW